MVLSKRLARARQRKLQEKKAKKPSNLSSYLELIRVKNCVMASIAVAIGFFVAGGSSILLAIISMLSAFLICGGGQAINDYFDAKIDSKLNKNKPIPSGRITKTNAFLFSAWLFLLGLIVASFVNETTTIIAVLMIILLSVYSAIMQNLKWVGNYIVALGTAITFLFGAAAANNLHTIVLYFFATAFFSNLAREVTKDLEDIKKDKGNKITLPILVGELNARMFVYLFHVIAAAIAIDAYILYNLGVFYLLAIILAMVIFGISIELTFEKRYSESQNKAKSGMLLSLVAFISTLFR